MVAYEVTVKVSVMAADEQAARSLIQDGLAQAEIIQVDAISKETPHA